MKVFVKFLLLHIWTWKVLFLVGLLYKALVIWLNVLQIQKQFCSLWGQRYPVYIHNDSDIHWYQPRIRFIPQVWFCTNRPLGFHEYDSFYLSIIKLGCVVRMVVDFILLHEESGPNDHRKDAPQRCCLLSFDDSYIVYDIRYIVTIKWIIPVKS